MVWLADDEKKIEDTFIRFDRIHERDGRTDGHTNTEWRPRPRLHASRGKTSYMNHWTAQLTVILNNLFYWFLPRDAMHSAGHRKMSARPAGRLSVRLSHAGILLK